MGWLDCSSFFCSWKFDTWLFGLPRCCRGTSSFLSQNALSPRLLQLLKLLQVHHMQKFPNNAISPEWKILAKFTHIWNIIYNDPSTSPNLLLHVHVMTTHGRLAYFVVHDVGIGLGSGLIFKRSRLVEQFVCNDAKGPPVAANTIVCRLVQTGQDLRSYVLWGTHWEAGLKLWDECKGEKQESNCV